MGGEIQWHGLAVLAEWYGINDIDQLLCDLILIRDFQHESNA